MIYRKPEKGPSTQIRITDEIHRDDYNKLMTLYRIAEHADGIQALVISCLKTTGIWGVAHETWGETCGELHITRQQADRRASEGDVARKLLSGDPFLRAIKSQIKVLSGSIPQVPQQQEVVNGASEFPQKNDQIYQNDKSTPDLAELPQIESKYAIIARDSKLLRIIKTAPENKWVEIATEAANDGPPTRESVKAAVEKIAPDPKKAKAGTIPANFAEAPMAPFRKALAEAVAHFTALLAMPDVKLKNATTGIGMYVRKVTKEARQIGKNKK